MTRWILAEFRTEHALLEAARRLRAEGHADVDLHSPVPIPEAAEALGLPRSRLPLLCLAGGSLGVTSGYAMQWWMVAVDFPINVGNRPPHSPLAFVPITFELGILLAALAVFVGLLVRCGLPRPHHPAFEVDAFRNASVDGLWLSLPFDGDGTAVLDELRALGARSVEQVAGSGWS
ncbi:MAG: DUF3341 domain-containing protein [Anaeromyxobacteraceae bacterium]